MHLHLLTLKMGSFLASVLASLHSVNAVSRGSSLLSAMYTCADNARNASTRATPSSSMRPNLAYEWSLSERTVPHSRLHSVSCTCHYNNDEVDNNATVISSTFAGDYLPAYQSSANAEQVLAMLWLVPVSFCRSTWPCHVQYVFREPPILVTLHLADFILA